MKRRWSGLLFGLWLGIANAVYALPGDEIEVAIFPYLSVHQLLELYEPLRHHLSEAYQRPVRLVTARDFPTFVADTHARSYPLLITAPHMARLAEVDAGYHAVLRPEVTLYPIVVVAADSGIERLEQLAGHQVATPDAAAIITLMGVELLGEAGLVVGEQVGLVAAGSHNNAIERLLRDPEVAAAIIANRAYGVVADRFAGRVERLPVDAREAAIPPVVYLAGPHLSAEQRAELTERLLDFANHSEAGQAMMARAHHEALRPFGEAERRWLDRLLPRVREAFAAP